MVDYGDKNLSLSSSDVVLFGSKEELIPREEWAARKAKAIEKLEEPVKHLVLTWTETETCKNNQDCMKIVKEIQNSHVNEEGLPDIRYNFLIGGDGSVFEGRGWGVCAQVPSDDTLLKDLDCKSLLIAFIGPKGSTPGSAMLMALARLASLGVKEGKITRKLQVVKMDEKETEFHDYDLDDEKTREEVLRKRQRLQQYT